MKKVLSLSIAMFAALFVSCSETPTNDTSVNKEATLSVVVSDAVSGGIINAEVSLLGVDKINSYKKTDGAGTVKYKVQAGDAYTFKVKADGYAPLVCQADIYAAAAANILQAINFTSYVELYKNTAIVKGYAYYQDPTTLDVVKKGAENAEVELELTYAGASVCEFENAVLKAPVAADGLYEFANVPEYSSPYLNFSQFEKDALFANDGDYINVSGAGETVLIPAFTYTTIIIQAPVLLNSTISVEEVDETITLEFSENISANEEKTFIQAWNGDFTVEVSGKTVKVTPEIGSEWDITGGFDLDFCADSPVAFSGVRGCGYETVTVNYTAP